MPSSALAIASSNRSSATKGQQRKKSANLVRTSSDVPLAPRDVQVVQRGFEPEQLILQTSPGQL